MVCVERTIGSEIVLDAPDGRNTVSVEHTIVSEIILDAADGTPRLCGSCGISFRSVYRQRQCRCKIGAWFALDALDGTTR